METTADFNHGLSAPRRRLASSPTAPASIVRKRVLAAGLLTGGFLAVTIAMLVVLGAAVLPMFLIPFPGLVLLWSSVDEVRADEVRDANG